MGCVCLLRSVNRLHLARRALTGLRNSVENYMSGKRAPGPVGEAGLPASDSGTLCLNDSPTPGPLGSRTSSTPDLESTLGLLRTEALDFATRFIQDGAARLEYLRSTERVAATLLEEVRKGHLTPFEGAEEAHKLRNAIMEAARLRSSDIGRAHAQALKATGRTLRELEEYYAQKLLKKAFDTLSQAEKNQVWMEIVEASGRPRPTMNIKAAQLAKAGRALVFVSVAFAVYNIATAENRGRQAVKEGTTAGAGILGGMAGGAVAGLVCGPGAPVCVVVGVFVGGGLAAFGADVAFDGVWHSP